MAKSKREAYFILAQILAILSGTFIVASGIFANISINSYSAIQSNVGLIYQSKNVEPNAKDYLLTANNLLKGYALWGYRLAGGAFIFGMIGVVGSFFMWYLGYRTKKGNMITIVLVKWHIKKGQESEFKEYWNSLNNFKSDGLFREVLSEVKKDIPEKFRTWKDLHKNQYTTFINVGIWDSLKEFDKAIGKFMPKIKDFEYKPRERRVLTYVSDREGDFILPKAKFKAKEE